MPAVGAAPAPKNVFQMWVSQSRKLAFEELVGVVGKKETFG